MEPKKNVEAQSSEKQDAIGEGNYEATRRYNEGLAKSVEKGNAEELAEKAKQALEGPEGEELREAEKRGKQAATKNAR